MSTRADAAEAFAEIAAEHDRCVWLDGGGAREWSRQRSIIGWLAEDDVSLTYDAAVHRHHPLHPEADSQHRPTPVEEHLPADREVPLFRRVAGARREDDVLMPQHVRRLALVVLHDRREHARHPGDQVDEVVRVRVVVVDHDDVRRPGHSQPSGRSTAETRSWTMSQPRSVRIDSAWNCTPR